MKLRQLLVQFLCLLVLTKAQEEAPAGSPSTGIPSDLPSLLPSNFPHDGGETFPSGSPVASRLPSDLPSFLPSDVPSLLPSNSGSPSATGSPTEKKNCTFIIVSGGPGIYDARDPEHDQSWANYVTPPLLLTDTNAEKGAFTEECEEVLWLIYEPAYKARWENDLIRNPKETNRIKNLGFESYVDLLKKRALDRDWKLKLIQNDADFWKNLDIDCPISRLWYYGHAQNDLWLTLDHDSEGKPTRPRDTTAVVKAADIANFKAKLKPLFEDCPVEMPSKFFGCRSELFAKKISKATGVESHGCAGVCDFEDIFGETGPQPSCGMPRNYVDGELE